MSTRGMWWCTTILVCLVLGMAGPASADVTIHDRSVIGGPAFTSGGIAWADEAPDVRVAVRRGTAGAKPVLVLHGSAFPMLSHLPVLSAAGDQLAVSVYSFPYKKCCSASDRFEPLSLRYGSFTGTLSELASCQSEDRDAHLAVTALVLARLACQPTFVGPAPVFAGSPSDPASAIQIGTGLHLAAAGQFVAWADSSAVTVYDTRTTSAIARPATDVTSVSLAQDGSAAWLANGLHWARAGEPASQVLLTGKPSAFAALPDGAVAAVAVDGRRDQLVRVRSSGSHAQLGAPFEREGSLATDGTRVGYAARTCAGAVLRAVKLSGAFPAEATGPCSARILARGLIRVKDSASAAHLEVWDSCQFGAQCVDHLRVKQGKKVLATGTSSPTEGSEPVELKLTSAGGKLAGAGGPAFIAKVFVTRTVAGKTLRSTRSVRFARPETPRAKDGLPGYIT